MIAIHRFQKEDMERLLYALELPAYYECVQRPEALMILLSETLNLLIFPR